MNERNGGVALHRLTLNSLPSRLGSHPTDVDDVKFVVNFDYPASSEDYVHRIGRTGRSQNTGTAYTFFTPNNAKQARDLISVLQEANQEISPKLIQLAEMARSGAFGKGRSRFGNGRYSPDRDRFGGRGGRRGMGGRPSRDFGSRSRDADRPYVRNPRSVDEKSFNGRDRSKERASGPGGGFNRDKPRFGDRSQSNERAGPGRGRSGDSVGGDFGGRRDARSVDAAVNNDVDRSEAGGGRVGRGGRNFGANSRNNFDGFDNSFNENNEEKNDIGNRRASRPSRWGNSDDDNGPSRPKQSRFSGPSNNNNLNSQPKPLLGQNQPKPLFDNNYNGNNQNQQSKGPVPLMNVQTVYNQPPPSFQSNQYNSQQPSNQQTQQQSQQQSYQNQQYSNQQQSYQNQQSQYQQKYQQSFSNNAQSNSNAAAPNYNQPNSQQPIGYMTAYTQYYAQLQQQQQQQPNQPQTGATQQATSLLNNLPPNFALQPPPPPPPRS